MGDKLSGAADFHEWPLVCGLVGERDLSELFGMAYEGACVLGAVKD